MRILSIRPANKTYGLRIGILAMLKALAMTGDIYNEGRGYKLVNVRLLLSKPHISPYNGGNWKIETHTDKKGKKRLRARNVHFPRMTNPIRNAKFLNYNDWARLNNALNDLCDKMDVSCNITSSTHIIRRGIDRNWRKKEKS